MYLLQNSRRVTCTCYKGLFLLASLTKLRASQTSFHGRDYIHSTAKWTWLTVSLGSMGQGKTGLKAVNNTWLGYAQQKQKIRNCLDLCWRSYSPFDCLSASWAAATPDKLRIHGKTARQGESFFQILKKLHKLQSLLMNNERELPSTMQCSTTPAVQSSPLSHILRF
jgi:hypothetical protein